MRVKLTLKTNNFDQKKGRRNIAKLMTKKPEKNQFFLLFAQNFDRNCLSNNV